MMRNRIFTLTTMGLLALALVAGCTTPPDTSVFPTASPGANVTASQPASTAVVSLTGSGATFPAPLYTQWFDEYNKLTGTRISYNAVGSGQGISDITAGTVNFGASDGLLTAAQLTAAQNAYGALVTIPMTADAVPVIYNIAGITSGQLKLSGSVVANIFLGTVTKWNDAAVAALNPGLNLPNASIVVVHRSDSSGTTNIFTNFLDKVSPGWHSCVGTANSVPWPVGLGGSGNAGVAGLVAQTPNSIGYVGLAYAIQNNLACAQLQNASGSFISPSMASATAAANGVALPDDMRIMITNSSDPAAYPIVGFTWILVYQNQTDKNVAGALVKMLWWAIHDGQKDCPALNYVQLSPAAVLKAEALVKAINYQGQALPVQ
jgi:phosphate transport system substrate-binding protein